MKKSMKNKWIILLLISLLTTHHLLLTDVNGATANLTVNAGKFLCPVSPYVYGHNSSNYYCPESMSNPVVIQAIKDVGLTMFRCPAGATIQRFDFKYNNYKGRMWNAGLSVWATDSPSIEDELKFCIDTSAEPLVGVNVSFSGPNGTSADDYDSHSNDYLSYTGCYPPDTPENRAKYAADMVTYIRSLCASKGWTPPVYYGIGNEYMCDGQTAGEYLACFSAYYTAMKAVDNNIRFLGETWSIPELGDKLYAFNLSGYNSFRDAEYLLRARYWPAIMDGAFGYMTYDFGGGGRGNEIKTARDTYASSGFGEPLFCQVEWADSWGTFGHNTDYEGAMYWAHMLYREIKNKVVIGCSWMSIQSNWSDSAGLFTPTYQPFAYRPRAYVYKQYTNFGNNLVECYDPAEYTPGVTDYFNDYKDDRDDLIVIASTRTDGNVTIMATNLSRTTSYTTQITINGFEMGKIDAYVMHSSNCYQGGPGPSSSTLVGAGNPFTYTFEPFSVTCLVVKKPGDTTPPSTIVQVRDGTGADVGSTILTTQLSANWDTSNDPQSGILKYQYAIGTTAGGTDVVNWTDNATFTSVTKTGLTLTAGQKYYFTVRAINGEGLQNTATSSNGQTVGSTDTTGPTTPSVPIYPNPYSLSRPGGINFVIDAQSSGEITIYSINGKLVRKLSGTGVISWDGTNEDGEIVTCGVYFYRIAESNGDRTEGKIGTIK